MEPEYTIKIEDMQFFKLFLLINLYQQKSKLLFGNQKLTN